MSRWLRRPYAATPELVDRSRARPSSEPWLDTLHRLAMDRAADRVRLVGPGDEMRARLRAR